MIRSIMDKPFDDGQGKKVSGVGKYIRMYIHAYTLNRIFAFPLFDFLTF